MTRGFEEQIDDIRAEVRALLEASPSWPDDEARARLARLKTEVDTLGADTTVLLDAIEREAAQLDEVLDVFLALGRLDFSRRARIVGDRPLDALAATANMLAEELEIARREMADATAAAEAATLAKSRFLAHMSHEIRTPLTALIGFADLLTTPTLSESDRLNYAMIIRRNGEHLLSVINDILDLSRVEAGRLAIERIACAPVEIFAEVASLMRLRARASGLEFTAALSTPVPAEVTTDPTRVRQILLNLVGNAIKFTPEGEVAIRLGVADGALVFEVQDSGPGIPADVLARLFQPFEQADLSMSRRFGGSGLGLAISRAIADALGGAIEIDSELGRGSRFRLRVPIAITDGVAMVTTLDEVAAARAAQPTTPRLVGRALVVEDGIDNQVLIVTLLRGWGIDVAVARDGRAAVARARAGGFDIVLMDMQMPIMDGYQATAALRAGGHDGPIIALTAHAMAGERERCLAAGCDDYVAKPIDRGQLYAALAARLPRAAAAAPSAPLVYSTFAGDLEMQPIIARFVAALPARLAAIRAEARAAGSTALPRLVHQLKGAAGGYGFAEITTAAAEIEQQLRAGGAHADVLVAIDALEALCARTRGGTP